MSLWRQNQNLGTYQLVYLVVENTKYLNGVAGVLCAAQGFSVSETDVLANVN